MTAVDSHSPDDALFVQGVSNNLREIDMKLTHDPHCLRIVNRYYIRDRISNETILFFYGIQNKLAVKCVGVNFVGCWKCGRI